MYPEDECFDGAQPKFSVDSRIVNFHDLEVLPNLCVDDWHNFL